MRKTKGKNNTTEVESKDEPEKKEPVKRAQTQRERRLSKRRNTVVEEAVRAEEPKQPKKKKASWADEEGESLSTTVPIAWESRGRNTKTTSSVPVAPGQEENSWHKAERPAGGSPASAVPTLPLETRATQKGTSFEMLRNMNVTIEEEHDQCQTHGKPLDQKRSDEIAKTCCEARHRSWMDWMIVTITI